MGASVRTKIVANAPRQPRSPFDSFSIYHQYNLINCPAGIETAGGYGDLNEIREVGASAARRRESLRDGSVCAASPWTGERSSRQFENALIA